MKHNSKIIAPRFRWSKIILLILSMSSVISFAQQAEKPTKEQRESQTALRLAQKSLKNDNFIQAEADYRKAIALDPENQDAKYNLGTAYYEKNKNDEAMLRFKQAAKSAKTKEEKHSAFHNLGNTFMNAEKYREAVESYKNALRNDPTDDETRYNLALAKELLEKNPPPPEDQDQEQEQDQEQDEDQEQVVSEDEAEHGGGEYFDSQDGEQLIEGLTRALAATYRVLDATGDEVLDGVLSPADILSRGIVGSRISLTIALAVVTITTIVGTLVGITSGYIGGVLDAWLQRFVEFILAFPQLPLYLALTSLIPVTAPSSLFIAFVIGVMAAIGWAQLSREVRSKTLSLARIEYVRAAIAVGSSDFRIITRHILPNVLSHVIVAVTLAVPTVILLESFLGFLGFAVKPPLISWGLMLQDTATFSVIGSYPWILSPVVFVLIAVFAFNALGDGLRDAVDPY